jgi:hypothetical protein
MENFPLAILFALSKPSTFLSLSFLGYIKPRMETQSKECEQRGLSQAKRQP